MIVECPNCGKRVSSRHAVCPYCRAPRDAATDGPPTDDRERRLVIRRRYRTQAQLYLATLLAVAAVAWAYVDSGGLDGPPGPWPVGLFVLGAGWYLLVRILMLFRRFGAR